MPENKRPTYGQIARTLPPRSERLLLLKRAFGQFPETREKTASPVSRILLEPNGCLTKKKKARLFQNITQGEGKGTTHNSVIFAPRKQHLKEGIKKGKRRPRRGDKHGGRRK